MYTTVSMLAEEYFSLTGRPIATMTVDEFIAFKNAVSASLINNDTGYAVSQTSQNAILPSNQNLSMPISSGDISGKMLPAPENNNTQPSTVSETPSAGASVVQMQEDKNTKRKVQLSMLKSISG